MCTKLVRCGLAVLVVAATALCRVVPALAAESRPNILVIWGDDIGRDNISAYSMGMMGYQTPSIDRLAREGALFTDSYAQQSCTAGRASFDRQFWYDGRSVTLYDPATPFYASESAPADIDAMLQAATTQLGFSPPLSDLMFRNPYLSLRDKLHYGCPFRRNQECDSFVRPRRSIRALFMARNMAARRLD